MKIKLMILVVLYLSLLTTAGSAQTAAEQMQSAIYTQETTGDLDSAVQMYRQILAATPPRPLGAQAQFRLAQALLQKGDLQDAALEFHTLSQSYPEYKGMIASMASQLRLGIPLGELGTLENGGYRNFLTNVEFKIPGGWSFKGSFESSGIGQMAIIESASGNKVQVWMKPLAIPPANIAPRFRKEMENIPSRRSPDWKIRPESVQERTLSGHPGMSTIADYTESGKPMVEYDFWVLTGTTHVFFFGQAEQQELETLQADIETVANSAQIP
jgi:tetratricopeptide (TPR) repeat protein